MNKIVKKFLFAAIVSLASTMAWSWSWTQYNESMQGNKFLLNAGVGAGYAKAKYKYGYTDYYGHHQEWSDYGTINGLALPVKGEFLLQKIPLGIYLSARPLIGHFSYNEDWHAFSISIIPGADYHVDTGVKGLDFYFGAGMGVYITTIKWEYPYWDNNGNRHVTDGRYTGARFAFDTHAGVSYYFTDHFGVNGEVGWPTYISASAAFKF